MTAPTGDGPWPRRNEGQGKQEPSTDSNPDIKSEDAPNFWDLPAGGKVRPGAKEPETTFYRDRDRDGGSE